MHTPITKPELLAPAGDWDSLRAAVANGADAVYFGLSRFNARHRAHNFTTEELPKVIDFLHSRNVKGFVTFNTLIFSDELEAAAEYVREIAAAGVDAVIVQDFGLARLIHRTAPGLHIHGSTQMTLSEARGVNFAKEHLHIERAVLARELSVADIGKISAASDVPLEAFVHGALCVAYSGQCLTSESLGGRSANRGQCAQACRLPYEMLVDGERQDLGDRAYLLSPQDLAAHDLVDDMVKAGVVSFKIEGRLKGPAYVAATTQTYRAAIDASIEKRAFHLSKGQGDKLTMTFSRGFIPGFLAGLDHQKTVQGRFPKSRGVLVGRVKRVQSDGVVVHSERPDFLKPGDGVVFDLGKPAEKEPGGRLWQVRQMNRTDVLLSFAEGFSPETVPVDSRVWKTDDPALNKELEHSFVGDPIVHRRPVHVVAKGDVGEPFTIVVTDEDGHRAEAVWPGPLQEARKHPLTAESLKEQFDRLEETPFKLGSVVVECPRPVMVPKSVLNDLRRQATQRLHEGIEAGKRVPIVDPNSLASLRARMPVRREAVPIQEAKLTAMVRTMDQLDAVLAWRPDDGAPGIEIVHCDFEDVRRYKEAVPRARAAGVPISLAGMRIIKPGEEGFLTPILQAEPDAVLVRNLATLLVFKEKAPHIRRIGDFSLNVSNELTADLFMSQGLERLTPSYDLNWDQFQDLVRNADPQWFEATVHQRMPMFHMEHCVFAAFLSTGKDHRDCGRPCDRHRVELKDRAGADFPVIPDAGCRNTVYNSQVQSAVEYLPRMLALGLRIFRVELLRENAEETRAVLATYSRALAGRDDGRETWKRLRVLHQLGVTRGTLKLV